MVKTSGSLVGDSGNRQPPGSGPATPSPPSRHSTRTTWVRPGRAYSPTSGWQAPGVALVAGPVSGTCARPAARWVSARLMASSVVLPDCSPLSRTIAPTWDRGSKHMLLVNPAPSRYA